MIPIFPLPNAVLFPNVFLPLHIFEDRYRKMVRDVLAGDHIIGMVLLRSKTVDVAEPCPPVYEVGCSGVITHSELLEEGRFNIVLRGLERFRILEEDHTQPYRRARVEGLLEPAVDDSALRDHRQRLEGLLHRRLTVAGSETGGVSCMPDGDLVNALSQYLDLDPIEKQALLERNGLLERCRSLVELLEMHALTNGHKFPPLPVQ